MGARGAIRLDPEGHAFHIDFDVHYASDFEYTLDDCDEFNSSAETPHTCWLLRLTSIVSNGASEQRRGPYILFLILAEVETRANEFKRVGFAQVDGSLPKRRPFGMKFPNAESDLFISRERKKINLV